MVDIMSSSYVEDICTVDDIPNEPYYDNINFFQPINLGSIEEKFDDIAADPVVVELATPVADPVVEITLTHIFDCVAAVISVENSVAAEPVILFF